jgi:hypothetical protein
MGFMLPGFVLMLALSWFYVAHGIAHRDSPPHSPPCRAAVLA